MVERCWILVKIEKEVVFAQNAETRRGSSQNALFLEEDKC